MERNAGAAARVKDGLERRIMNGNTVARALEKKTPGEG
jgi:hypothetical protein